MPPLLRHVALAVFSFLASTALALPASGSSPSQTPSAYLPPYPIPGNATYPYGSGTGTAGGVAAPTGTGGYPAAAGTVGGAAPNPTMVNVAPPPPPPPYPVPGNSSYPYGTGTAGTPAPSPSPSPDVRCSDAAATAEWGVRGFRYASSDVYSTPAHRILNGDVSFSLVNTALRDSFPGDYVAAECSAHSSRATDFFYGDQVFGCRTPGDVLGLYSGLVTFSWDTPGKTLVLNQTWGCGDKGYDIKYSATGAFVLPIEYDPVEYTNPNWTIGSIYKSTTVDVGPVDLPPFRPSRIRASAGLA